VTAHGPQACHAHNLVEAVGVDLPYDWVSTYRFFHPTPTTVHTPEMHRSLFDVFPHMGPLLHLHHSWIQTHLTV
jgi:hypothetical protein